MKNLRAGAPTYFPQRKLPSLPTRTGTAKAHYRIYEIYRSPAASRPWLGRGPYRSSSTRIVFAVCICHDRVCLRLLNASKENESTNRIINQLEHVGQATPLPLNLDMTKGEQLMNIPPNNQTNRRILVIDDNRGIHNSFREILRSAALGKSALEEAEARLFGEAPSGRRTLGSRWNPHIRARKASSCYEPRSIKASPTPWLSSICECRPGWMASKRS